MRTGRGDHTKSHNHAFLVDVLHSLNFYLTSDDIFPGRVLFHLFGNTQEHFGGLLEGLAPRHRQVQNRGGPSVCGVGKRVDGSVGENMNGSLKTRSTVIRKFRTSTVPLFPLMVTQSPRVI